MKKYLLAQSIVALLAAATHVQAAESGVYLSPTLDYYRFDPKQGNDVDDGAMYGLNYGYQINKYLSVDGRIAADLKNDSLSAKEANWGATLYLMPDAGISPYLSAALGRTRIEPEGTNRGTEKQYSFGAGAIAALDNNSSVSLGLVANREPKSDNSDYGARLAYRYTFAAAEAAPEPVVAAPEPTPEPAPAPVDSDGDGVYDDKDQCPNTPRGAKVDDVGCTIQLKENVSLKLNVNFDYDKSDVKPAYRSEIGKLAEFLTSYPDTNVVVEGHTDSRGTDSYNQKLSERRAKAVADYLAQEFGIASHRVSYKGYGEVKPIASNKTEAGRAENRRVVGVVSAIVVRDATK